MAEPSVEDLITRLERERQEADRLYNDALSAVDRAIQALPNIPEPPAAYDLGALAGVNKAWDILPHGAPAVDRSVKGRLRGFIWRLVGPPLDTQKHFNASVVDHLNRNARAHEELPRATAAVVHVLRRELEALARFESLLVQYLQTITIYVDARDRSLGVSELKERLALIEQRVLTLRRGSDPMTKSVIGSDPLQATYVAFEDRFRGPQGEIRRRVEDYLPLFASASDVVDIGCGRGELLDLLKQRGIKARGVDANPDMVDVCRSRGLDVEHGDALGFLQRQPDGGIGGLAAIQVVEHFEPTYLARFLDTAHQKMRSGAPLVLETINAACWMAFFETYIRDLTHMRPLHPDTLRYLVQASGFQNVDVQLRAPVGEGDKLDRVPETAAAAGPTAPDLARIAHAVNAHADKLNARLFSSMDYAVIGRR